METALNWGDVATWITGIATIALFVIGFIQIRNERRFRISREKELENLKKREQSEHISAWLVGKTQNDNKRWVAILNQSKQPIYQVVVNVVTLSQRGDEIPESERQLACISVAPPGQGYTSVAAVDFAHPGHGRAGVEIAFQDGAGRSWLRKPNGELLELEKSTVEHYNITLPTFWADLLTEIPLPTI